MQCSSKCVKTILKMVLKRIKFQVQFSVYTLRYLASPMKGKKYAMELV